MLKLTNPGLRRSNVVLDSFSSCVANAPKEFSRAPEVPFSKIVSQPGMFFKKFKSRIALKQLKSFADTRSQRKLNKQGDVVDSNVKLVNFESFSISRLSQEKPTIHSKPIELKRVFSILISAQSGMRFVRNYVS